MTPRVLSYPPRHDYVDRLHPSAATLVHRDEPWPLLPALYDPAWVAEHHGEWDVAHLHFTWEQHPLDRVAAVLDSHRTAGTPVVWTAHDLRNPHTPSDRVDEPYLRLLARTADRVLTLTSGAAQEIARTFGRDAEVVPHGPILDPPEMSGWRRRRPPPTRPSRQPLRLLLHGKSLRAALDWPSALDAMRLLVDEGAPVRLDVLVHAHAPDRAALEHAVRDAALGDALVLRVHDALSLEELLRELVATDALVLPYRWGTHSGLLELAADVAVPVVAADVGHLRDQSPALLHPPGADGLAAAVRRLLHDGPPPPVPVEERVRGRDALLGAHRGLYAALVTSRGTPAGAPRGAPPPSASS